jgi:hypothetical protein
MKQTAVEWLESELRKLPFVNVLDVFEQAKEMEKQQMIEFGYACANQIDMNDNGELLMVKSPKELYNEKYGGNNAE